MKRNNIPLNIREKNNSKISLLCSIVVLAVLFLLVYQIDYSLIRKPQKEASEATALEQQKSEDLTTRADDNHAPPVSPVPKERNG